MTIGRTNTEASGSPAVPGARRLCHARARPARVTARHVRPGWPRPGGGRRHAPPVQARGDRDPHPACLRGPARPAARRHRAAACRHRARLRAHPGRRRPDHAPAGHIDFTSLDPLVTPAFIGRVGAVAVKLLVIWRAGRGRGRTCRPGIGLHRHRPPGWCREPGRGHRQAGWRRAVDVGPASGTRRSSPRPRSSPSFGPTIYKAEVPGYSEGDLSRVHGESVRMSQVVGGPWVVLSNGVRQADFAEAVRIACAGGAHGFLAGRAIWSDVVGEQDQAPALRTRSARQWLDQMVEIVEHSMRERVPGTAREEEG